MPATRNDNALAEKRHIIVILRLVVDRHGRLLDGQLVDVEGTLGGRFHGWCDVTSTVRNWLAASKWGRQESERDGG